MAKRHYLVTSSFAGCLPENGFVVNTMRDAAEGIREMIRDYSEAHSTTWNPFSQKEEKNPDFSVSRFYHPKNGRMLVGAHIVWSSYGGGINLSVDEIDAETAKEWEE